MNNKMEKYRILRKTFPSQGQVTTPLV